jgi:monoamine oxidase
MNRAGAPDEATAYLQQLRFDGRPLHDWDIGVLLRDVVSGEAYASFLTAFGASANFRNANAYDAIATLMSEWAPQRGFVVEGGFQRLPLEMARRSSADVHTSAPVIGIGPGPHGGVRLSLKHDGVQRTVFANRVILALPPDALRRIRLETRPADVRALNAQLSTVRPVSACKLFLSFARPWWPTRHSPSALSIDASYTDQPMQQCYYYGASEGAPALLLAVFADDQTTFFWRPLFEADTGAAADRMIAESLRQLRAMHPDAGIPDPIGARARLWAAAWHVWKPGARSWETARVLRGPHLGLRAFVCGEAFSTQQGWVEGALNSAAALLHEHFGLDLLL